MEYGVPVRSTDASHKFEVRVWDSRAGREALVRFGHPAYEDFTQHRNSRRRANYLARSAGIRDGAGRLTKDDPLSANYWSRRFLWASGEPYADASPGRAHFRRPSARATSPRATSPRKSSARATSPRATSPGRSSGVGL